jgi:hypothetical protein
MFSVFSRHSREGGNPGFFVFKENGFPITTSGMTTNAISSRASIKSVRQFFAYKRITY